MNNLHQLALYVLVTLAALILITDASPVSLRSGSKRWKPQGRFGKRTQELNTFEGYPAFKANEETDDFMTPQGEAILLSQMNIICISLSLSEFLVLSLAKVTKILSMSIHFY